MRLFSPAHLNVMTKSSPTPVVHSIEPLFFSLSFLSLSLSLQQVQSNINVKLKERHNL